MGGLDISNVKTVIGEIQRDYLYFINIERGPKGLKRHPRWPEWGVMADKAWMEIDLGNKKAFWPERKTGEIKQTWCGQTMFWSGIDESSKNGQLLFNDDQKQAIYSFWLACQTLTGTEQVHSAFEEPDQNMTLGIARVDVSKTRITSYRRLKRVKVFGVKSSDCDKAGTSAAEVTVDVVWDLGEFDKKRVGQLVSISASPFPAIFGGIVAAPYDEAGAA